MTAERFQKMGGTGLIAEAQLVVFMWCRIVDNGAHHACWLLLQALFMTAVGRDPLGLPFRATSCSGRVNSSGGLEKFTAHDLCGSAFVWAPIIRVVP
jgi:hypothetical protein